MSDSMDDRVAVMIAHDSAIARALSSSVTTIARAWDTSAVRRWSEPVPRAFSTLTTADRLRYGLVAVGAAVVTRLILLFL